MKELEQIYEMYKHIVHENPDDYNQQFIKNENDCYFELSPDTGKLVQKTHYYDEHNNEFTINARFYTYLNSLRKFNGFPSVISDMDFFRLQADRVFHGFRDIRHGKSLLSDFNYHHGNKGSFGTHFSDNPSEAFIYTENNQYEKDKNRIMEAKILPGKYINMLHLSIIGDAIERSDDEFRESSIYNRFKNDVYKIKDFFKQHESDGFMIESFKRTLLNNQILATLLGFDYIIHNMSSNNNHYIVLNRNKFAVSTDEYNRFYGENSTENISEK